MQIERRDEDGGAVLTLSGSLDAGAAGVVLQALRRTSKASVQLTLDLSAIRECDTVGVATLAECLVIAQDHGCRLKAAGLSPALRKALKRAPAPSRRASQGQAALFERVGDGVVHIFSSGVAFAQLLADAAYWSLVAPLRGLLPPPGATVDQGLRMGVQTFPIVSLTAFLLGLIVTFLGAHQLRQFGANIFVANLVGVAMVRELGPLITAIVVAGRTGSAITAELGTMTVGEEVDALRTMGIDPIRFLVVPRVYAITFTQPALSLYAMAIGVVGGFVISLFYLDLGASVFFKQVFRSLAMSDLLQGLSKSVVFAWTISLTGCFYGLRITGGPAGVGRATTTSVVTSIFSIIVIDSIFAVASTVFAT